MSTTIDTVYVGKLLNIKPATVRRYMWESAAPGRRYWEHPFPPADGQVGKSSYWLANREQEIIMWAITRKGKLY